MLIEMGFSREVVEIACRRCEMPADDGGVQQRLDLIVTWLLEHPNAMEEEERRLEQERVEQEERDREERERQQQESSQLTAAQQFLQAIGEVCVCTCNIYIYNYIINIINYNYI